MLSQIILIFLYLTVLFYPLGSLGRISFASQQINIYPYELCMGLALCFLVMKHNLLPLKQLKSNNQALMVTLFLSILIFSYLIGINYYSLWANFVGFLYLIRLVSYLLFVLYLLFHIKQNHHFVYHIKKQIQFIILSIIFSSVVQYIFYPNLRNLLYQGWDPHLYRVFGFFFEPYLAGAGIVLSLFYTYFYFHPQKIWLRYLALFVLFTLFMLTFSRTVYVAAMVCIFLYFTQKHNIKMISILFSLFILLAILIPKPVGVGVQLLRTFSINTRLQNAIEGIQLWSKSPILGIGYDRIRYKKEQLKVVDKATVSHAASGYHSSFIIVLVSGGVFGLLGFLGLLKVWGGISRNSFYYIFFLSLLSLGDNALLHPFILFYLFLLLGVEFSRLSRK